MLYLDARCHTRLHASLMHAGLALLEQTLHIIVSGKAPIRHVPWPVLKPSGPGNAKVVKNMDPFIESICECSKRGVVALAVPKAYTASTIDQRTP